LPEKYIKEPDVIDPRTLPPATGDELIAEHVAHVPMTEPGLIGTVTFNVPGSGAQTFNILIDGRHRAARAKRNLKLFFCYLLTEDETQQIMTTSFAEMLAISFKRLAQSKGGQA
jgi:hypothetical protein